MASLTVGHRRIESRLIIFDKDGTLVDLSSLVLTKAKARRDCIQRLAGKEASRLWERIVGVDLKRGQIDPYGPLASMTTSEEISVASFSLYVNGHSWEEARTITKAAYDEADTILRPTHGATLLPGVKEKLELLKKHDSMLAVASNDRHKVIEESFSALDICSFFDAIVGSDDVVEGKPSPDMVKEILKKTGTKPEETVLVGDSVVDMEMGQRAGLNACIGVLTGSGTLEKLQLIADAVLGSVADLRICDSTIRRLKECQRELK